MHADADLTEELLDVERSGWESLRDGTASDFYGQLMTDDAVMVLANGQTMSRDDVVEALATASARGAASSARC